MPWTEGVEAREWHLRGRVQGVGFRPFTYRLAHRLGLAGWVRNHGGWLQVFAQGDPQRLASYGEKLLEEAPPLARPRIAASQARVPRPIEGFHILGSECSDRGHVHVPPDQFVCDDCLAELRDPTARRHGYPFINCTQCGPRYSILDALPWDRSQTAMAGFALCPACRAEYRDPLDRRFHAQPLACPDCGPVLSFTGPGATTRGNAEALELAGRALAQGGILAVRSVGGYHLACDARDGAAVDALRQRKRRPHKPLAVLFPEAGEDGLAAVARHCEIDAPAAEALQDPARPIVLLPQSARSELATGIAPGLDRVGALLPGNPLHHLLAEAVDGPLVLTSANLGGDPLIHERDTLETELGDCLDGVLDHDRPIRRPVDDSVVQVVAGHARPLRLARGIAPLELGLPWSVDCPVLAVGGHLKNTVALAWDERVVVSPHVGDLEAPRSLDAFRATIDTLEALYGVRARSLIADRHPDYASTRWAADAGLPSVTVGHHRAHASALAGEVDPEGDWLMFVWDGFGLGDDGRLWGGETFTGRPGHWRRAAHLRPFRIPGTGKASEQPWRSARGLRWTLGEGPSGADDALLHQAWERGVNSLETTSVGRLFDAAAGLCGLLRQASFEGQAAQWLESVANVPGRADALPLHADECGGLVIDWAPLVPMLGDGRRPVAERAGAFHAALAASIVALARRLGQRTGIRRVGLTGGVFQNRRLAELAVRQLAEAGFEPVLPARLPVNDGGLAFGQVIEATAP